MAGGKQLPDGFHAIEQEGIDDFKGWIAFQGLSELVIEANPFAIDDVPRQLFFKREIAGNALVALLFGIGKALREFSEGIINTNAIRIKAAFVPNELVADFAIAIIDAHEGQDLAGTDNGGI